MSTPPFPDAAGPQGRLDAAGQGVAEVGYEDRLLATAVASLAELDHSQAPAAAEARREILQIADPERRLVAWARSHPAAPNLRTWLSRLRRARTAILAAALVATAIAGWLAAQAALGLDRSRPTNVYWLLGGVLLPQTLLLVAWILVMLFGGLGALGVTAGGLLRGGVVRLLAGRAGREPAGVAAVTAIARLGSNGAIARWSVGVATNTLWTCFNAGVLASVLALLAVQQHSFCWESTIFSSEGYRRITAAVALLPAALGFATPDAAQIAAARLDPASPSNFGSQDEAARVAWSGLLIGSVVVYGLLPRGILALWCAAAMARAARRVRLDLDSPLLAPIASGLSRAGSAGEGQGDATWPSLPVDAAASEGRAATDGPGSSNARPAIVAIELAVPGCGWPPAPLTGLEVLDLGRIESREDRRAAVTALAALAPPMSLTVFVSLATAPDRGLASLLRELAAAARRGPGLVLTGGSLLRARGDGARVATRVDDWRAMAVDAGVPAHRVHEIDLEALTAASAAALRSIVTDGELSPPRRRIEKAAALIAEAADQWADQAGPPTVAAQAELHRAIGELHGTLREGSSWFDLLGSAPSGLSRMVRSGSIAPADIAAAVGRAGERFTGLLPPALRVRPKWMAAGALAGALGCVAAAFTGPAGLVIPVALQALPVWSGLGAAIGGVLSAGGGARTGAGAAEPGAVEADAAWATAIRAATLQAIVLELQGGGEARLARALEQALPEPDPDEALFAQRRRGAARRWLDGVRHRLDIALQRAETAMEVGT